MSSNSSSKKDSWRSLLYKFTQETTLHGVRYITDKTPFLTRRIIWSVIVLVATGLFTYFIADRLIELLRHPRAVDVEVIFNQTIIFPTVTICNQNFFRLIWLVIVLVATGFFTWFIVERLKLLISHPRSVDVEVIFNQTITFPTVTVCNQNVFRKTAAHYYGLHDMIVTGYSNLDDSDRRMTISEYEETVEGGFNLTTDTYLEGVGQSYTKYVNITAEVCKHVCLKVVSDACCSLVYKSQTRTCYITAMEPNMVGVRTVYAPGYDYYRRNKCQIQTEAECFFNDGSECNFVLDYTQVLVWKVIQAHDQRDGRPRFDHTEMSERGWYLHVHTGYSQRDAFARLMSPYFLSGNNTCITFYHQIKRGSLNIKMGISESDLTLIWSRGKRIGSVSTDWERGFAKVPQGYIRVYLEASSKVGDFTENVDISLDDIVIKECEPVPQCKQTPMGLGYAGSVSTAISGHTCAAWADVHENLRPSSWHFGNATSWALEENYCRNPDDDIRGPWCITNVETMQMEYCDVDPCMCQVDPLTHEEIEFQCTSGRCIANDQVCDQVNDCGDFADEADCQGFEPSINCTFENNWNCSYANLPNYGKWTLKSGGSGEFIMVEVPWMSVGDIAALVSPMVSRDTESCLTFAYNLSPMETLDVGYRSSPQSFVTNPLCTSLGDQRREEEWYTANVPIPSGVYFLVFQATVYQVNQAKIYINNITVTAGNCTEEPELTTTYLTTEADTTTVEPTTTVETTIETTTEEPTTTPTPIPTTNANLTDENGTSVNTTTATDELSPSNTTEYNATQYDDTTTMPDLTDSSTYNATENMTTITTTEMTTIMTTEPYVYEEGCHVNFLDCGTCQRDLDPYNFNVTYECLEQGRSITCSFTNCDCGYTYTGNSVQWYWRHPLTHQPENGTEPVDDPDTYLEPMHESSVPMYHYVRLLSPIWSLPGDELQNCLSFQYFSRYTDITLYLYNETWQEKYMKITYDGQSSAWHREQFLVPYGDLGVAFEFQYARSSILNGGVDNVTLTPGTCELTDVIPSVNCTFDTNDWCNYEDKSTGSRKWYRSEADSQEGQYFLRSRRIEEGKIMRRLASPIFEIPSPSCLTFKYFGDSDSQSGAPSDIRTIAVSLAPALETIWKVFFVDENLWLPAQADIPAAGSYSLYFDVNGQGYKAGIDDVLVLPHPCRPLNCTEDFFRCTSSVTCIPQHLSCDGTAHCPLGEDELDCEVDPDSIEDSAESEEGDVDTRFPDDDASIMEPVEHIDNLTQMYFKVGHQGEDFIYKCEWDGQDCRDGNMTKQVTDYGLCYTFNDKADMQLSTAKTGARFGLRLTLNIEQYEYMVGPNTDAGIKVFLHAQNELPQVRDLGFAIAPGLHALVGVIRNDASNLEDPWGECGSTNLTYFDEYMYSRCTVDCETILLNKTCACRDAYMPSRDEQPPVCNFEEYFECAVVALNTLGADGSPEDKRCTHTCPKPCFQTVYEPALSYALLSSMSVDQILTEDSTELQRRYDSALETRQRTDGEIFTEDLTMLNELIRYYDDIMRLVKEYLTSDEALFPNLLQAIKTFEKGIFLPDLGSLLGTMPDFDNVYRSLYDDMKNLLFNYSTVIATNLNEIDQVLYLTSRTNRVHQYTQDVSDRGVMYVTMQRETLNLLREALLNTTFAVGESIAQIQFLPQTFFTNLVGCDNNIIAFNQTLNLLEGNISLIYSYARSNNVNRLNKLRSVFSEISDQYLRYGELAKTCLQEYPLLLQQTIDWKREAEGLVGGTVNRIDSLNFDIESDLEKVEADADRARESRKQYTEAVITKLKMLEEILNEEAQDRPTTTISTFTTRVKSWISGPVREEINNARDTMENKYMEGMIYAASLSQYLVQYYFYARAEMMNLWRNPIPNIESPDTFDDLGTELWRIWDRNTNIQDFVSEEARVHIKAALNGYFSPLTDRVNTFEEQLDGIEKNLFSALEEVLKEYTDYQEERKIEHTFVANNFMNVDIYFKQLKFQKVRQIKAYEAAQFLSDVGGYLGLLLGASVLTIFELLDLIIYNTFKKYCYNKKDKSETNKNTTNTVGNNTNGPNATPYTYKA